MSQHPPAHDETVRMRPDGAESRPRVDASRPGPGGGPDGGAAAVAATAPAATDVREFDDTRPVPRDWLSGAPDADPADDTSDQRPGSEATDPAAPAPTQPQPADDDEWATQQLGSAQEIAAAGGAGVDLDEDSDETQSFPPVDDDPRVALGDETDDDAGRDGHGDDGGDDGGFPPTAEGGRPWWRRPAVLVPAGAVVLLGAAAYGVDLFVSSGELPRSTVVAGVEIGGLSPAAAREALGEDLAPRIVADRPFVADDVQGTFSPVTAGIALDVDATVRAADHQPLNPWTRLTSAFSDHDVAPVLATDDAALDAQLETVATSVDRAPVDATIAIDGTTPRVVEPTDGRTLDRDAAADTVLDALAAAEDPAATLELPVDVAPASVDTPEAERVLAEVVGPALAAPVTVTVGDGGRSAQVPVSALAASLTFTPTDEGELQVGIDPAALQTALGDDLAVFGTPARDATFEIAGNAVRVVPSVDGTGIDPAHLAEQLLSVLTQPAPRSVTADLGPVPAAFTTEQAQALGIVEKVSSFTTNFAMSPSATNIRVVAEEVDGALVKPGETFSLNDYTGVRGTAQGYVEANVISGGQLSKAVGGGISQFATTMFNAVFFAGLEDVHHKTHSFYISRYPAGREATVYDGLIDLVWKNDTDTGIYVQTQWVSGGSITVTFWGTKHYEIESVSGEKRNITQPAVQDKPADADCIPQSGSQGFDITVTRVFKDLKTGAVIRRENFNTHYIAEAIIHCTPPGGPAPAAPPPAGPDGTVPAGPAAPGGRRPGGRRGR